MIIYGKGFFFASIVLTFFGLCALAGNPASPIVAALFALAVICLLGACCIAQMWYLDPKSHEEQPPKVIYQVVYRDRPEPIDITPPKSKLE